MYNKKKNIWTPNVVYKKIFTWAKNTGFNCEAARDKVSEILDLAKTRLTRWDDFDTYYGCANQILWNSTLAGLGHFKKETIEKVFSTWGLYEEMLETELEQHIIDMRNFSFVCSNAKSVLELLK